MSQAISLNNIHKQYEKKEQQVITQAVQQGYKNPLTDHWQKETLFLPNGDRRYIKDLVFLDYKDLNTNQVREEVVDEKTCKTIIAPSIEKSGLDHPVMAQETAVDEVYDNVHGHNRAWTLDSLKQKIPTFVVTEPMNPHGNKVSKLSDIKSRIRPNKAQKNRQYTIQDMARQIKDILKIDPTIDGKNPSGKLPPLTKKAQNGDFTWDDLIDDIYGGTGHADHPSTRTKIRTTVEKNTGGSEIINMRELNSMTAFLTRIGWADGLSGTGKRLPTLQHLDLKRDSIIVMTDTNGEHINEKLSKVLISWFNDSDWKSVVQKHGIDKIDIVGIVYRPTTNIANLDQTRLSFVKKARQWNKIFKGCNIPFKVNEIAMPKQVKSSNDRDQIW